MKYELYVRKNGIGEDVYKLNEILNETIKKEENGGE